jgi:hypothetical protein
MNYDILYHIHTYFYKAQRKVYHMEETEECMVEGSRRVELPYSIKMRVGMNVSFVLKNLRERIHRLPLLSPFVIVGRIWVPTGTWKILKMDLTNSNLNLELAMVWMASDGEKSINPLGKEGVPSGFSAKFRLPHVEKFGLELFDYNASQQISPTLPPEHKSPLLSEFEEALPKEDYIAKDR